MLKSLSTFWNTISNLGLEENNHIPLSDKKRITFFNQALFIGFFATISQLASVWSFIGAKSLIFSIICINIIVSLILNAHGHFKIAKGLMQIVVYTIGTFMVTQLGGSAYYHLGTFTIFVFGLIVFDFKTEKWGILLGVPFVTLSLLIGELDLFGAPDFSHHEGLEVAKFSNLFGLFFVNFIFIIFIVRLNGKNEKALNIALKEKDALLQEVVSKTNALEQSKLKLEKTVEERTSEISKQKDILLLQNEEKEILLKEIHHRVKNNLQIITSLINLQLDKFDDQQTVVALIEVKSRVLSMSIVHQKMYESNNFKEIELSDYVNHLVGNIKDLYDSQDFKISQNIPANIKFNIDCSIPLGLILNEITTNFFKYGLDANKNSSFSIDISEKSNNYYQVICKDDGVGFPTGLNINDSESLGMQLIESLVEQLNGELRFYNDNGATYDFTIQST